MVIINDLEWTIFIRKIQRMGKECVEINEW